MYCDPEQNSISHLTSSMQRTVEVRVLTEETAKHHDIVGVKHELATGSLLVES